jgi:phage-related minor tail protein
MASPNPTLQLIIQLKDEASAGLAGLQGALLSVGAATTGAAVAGLAGISVAAFTTANDFAEAQRQMQAQLGITADEAAALADVSRQVFGNNFGADVADASAAVAELQQRLGLLGSEGPAALQGAAESAFALRDVFGVDVAESAAAAQTLMNEFGISSAQAFDLLASGFQRGLNSSGDFLDTIGEYSNLFAENGSTADQFFSLLETGLAGGVLGTDKAADAFKEFGIRIADGSKASADALAALGLSDLTTQLSSGAITATDAFGIVQSALAGVTDPLLQAQLGVALFGTQFEDLGASSVLGISLAQTSLADLAGSADSLNVKYDSLGAVVQTLWRQALLALEPFGIALLDLANAAMPLLLSGLEAAQPVFAALAGWLSGAAAGLSTFVTAATSGEFSGFTEAIGAIGSVLQANLMPALAAVGGVLAAVFAPALAGMLPALGAAVAGFGAAAGAAAVVVAPLALAGAAAVALYQAWQQNLGGIQEVVAGAMAAVGGALQAGAGVVSAVLGQIQAFWAANGAAILATATTAWGQVQGVIATVAAVIATIVGGIAGTITTIFGAIASFITSNSGTIQAVLSSAWNLIGGTITNALSLIQGVVTTVLGVIQGDWSKVLNGLRTIAAAVLGQLQNVFTNGLDLVRNAFDLALSAVRDILLGLVGDTPGIGRDIINGLINGVRGAATALLNAVRGVVTGALDAAKQALGIQSPSQEFADEVGEPIVAGIAQGMLENIQILLGAAQELSWAVLEEAKAFAATIQDAITPLLVGAYQGAADTARQQIAGLDLIAALAPTSSDLDRLRGEYRKLTQTLDKAWQDVIKNDDRIAELEARRTELLTALNQPMVIDADQQAAFDRRRTALEARLSVSGLSDERRRELQDQLDDLRMQEAETAALGRERAQEELTRLESQLTDLQERRAQDAVAYNAEQNRILAEQERIGRQAYAAEQGLALQRQIQQETEAALRAAQEQAATITNPEEQARFLAQQTAQIAEEARARQALARATTDEERTRLQQRLDLIREAQRAELQIYATEARERQAEHQAALQDAMTAIEQLGNLVYFTQQDVFGVGQDAILGIVAGMQAQAGYLQITLGDILEGALAAAQQRLGIASPSRVSGRELGLPFIQGIERELQAGQSTLQTAAQQAVDSMRVLPPIQALPPIGAGFGMAGGAGASPVVVSIEAHVHVAIPAGIGNAELERLAKRAAREGTEQALREAGQTVQIIRRMGR